MGIRMRVAAAASTLVLACSCVGLAASASANEPVAVDASTATEQAAEVEFVDKALLSLDEYAQQYPLQTEGWTKIREDDRSMGGMDIRWHAFCEQIGSDGIGIACGSCHIANYEELVAEYGEDIIMQTDAEYDVEWMGCGTCHASDLTAGVSAKTVYKDMFIEDFDAYISPEDAVCGQCHMIFPGTHVTMPEYEGTMDLYKYGISPEGILQAYKEAFAENPAIPTEEMQALFFHVGMTYFDDEIGTLIYGWDNETALEMYQGSKHQAMGLTCTDCHMPTVVAEDGTTYTEHYSCEPLASDESMAVCLTCHEQTGIEDAESMRAFVAEKQAELGELQAKTHEDLDALYALLADATANGGVEEDVLEQARTAYVDAYFFYVFERADDHGADDGAKAAHNFEGSIELLQKADALLTEAIESLS